MFLCNFPIPLSQSLRQVEDHAHVHVEVIYMYAHTALYTLSVRLVKGAHVHLVAGVSEAQHGGFKVLVQETCARYIVCVRHLVDVCVCARECVCARRVSQLKYP
jgi:hypothetical protein